jgi:hypothetical protein
MKKIILWTWCFLQSFLGLIIFLVLKIQKKLFNIEWHKSICICYINTTVFSGASLGFFIFINRESDKKHEYGHVIQSYILGPLYLIVVGLFSIINNIRSRFDWEFWSHYYEKYPEKWANNLANKYF